MSQLRAWAFPAAHEQTVETWTIHENFHHWTFTLNAEARKVHSDLGNRSKSSQTFPLCQHSRQLVPTNRIFAVTHWAFLLLQENQDMNGSLLWHGLWSGWLCRSDFVNHLWTPFGFYVWSQLIIVNCGWNQLHKACAKICLCNVRFRVFVCVCVCVCVLGVQRALQRKNKSYLYQNKNIFLFTFHELAETNFASCTSLCWTNGHFIRSRRQVILQNKRHHFPSQENKPLGIFFFLLLVH